MGRRIHQLLLLAIGHLALVGCGTPHSSGVSREHVRLTATAPAEPPAAAYQQAVKEAENAGPEAISRDLLALAPGQDGIWKDIGGVPHVLVATWTNYTGYPAPTPEDPNPQYNDGTYEIWVTAVPQLANFIRAYRPGGRAPTEQQLMDRLEQLLGLPPHADHALVIEMWVPGNAIFRPSADPEINDYEAQLEFPDVVATTGSGKAPQRTPYMTVSPAYRSWYKGQESSRYHPSKPPAYPWTRLGYTFDWGNPNSRVGMSEFVVMSGTTVYIESITPTEQYASKRKG